MRKLFSLLLLLLFTVGIVTSCVGTPPDGDGDQGGSEYTYLAFTPSELALIKEEIGADIPFLANDEYYVKETEDGVLFYTVGNTDGELLDYLLLFAEYELEDGYLDSKEAAHTVYSKGDARVDICSYREDGKLIIEVLLYSAEDSAPEGGDQGGNTPEGGDQGGNTPEGGDQGGSTPEGGDQGGSTPEGGDSGNTGGGSGSESEYIYTDFTDGEKALFLQYIGEVIPFVPNNEYYVEGYYGEFDYENGMNFYTFGNTQADFEAYRLKFCDYELYDQYEDEYGDTWYCYVKGDIVVDVSFYHFDEYYVIDLYVYSETLSLDPDDSGNTGGGSGSESEYIYTDFTDEEKALFLQYIGEVIPFVPNNDYSIEGYYGEFDYEYGMNFFTFGNTEADFEAYRLKFYDYELYDQYEDEYGDTWYCYVKGDIVVDVSFYSYEGNCVIDLYVYSEALSLDPDDSGSGSGGSGDSGNGDSDDTGGGIPSSDVITNEGAGLPEDDGDGVYDVDFTLGEKVKDVTDQGYYIDGCPTVGSPAVLVIPVQFKDATAASRGYTTDALVNAFTAGGVCDYYSVYDYYYISSYGQLSLDITVLDFWFTPENSSSYYYGATYDYYGDEIAIGDQLVMDEALAYLAEIMDLSDFDSDGNGYIDSVVLINTLDIGEEDFFWAYRYWNVYADSQDELYEYDGVCANDYIWASYQFLNESYDKFGNVSYDDPTVMNTYTFIHEFGHILGADDYYDTSYDGEPLGGCDIMDSMAGDNNAYTKFNFGWITSSRLVVGDTVTLTLDRFSKAGDTVILANDWDESLGAYQEYYIVVYYTMDGLNGGDYGYFERGGVVVYHVNASLFSEEIEGEIYYDVYNNNSTPSSDGYGTEDNLIELVKCYDGSYTYVTGDSLSGSIKDDSGEALGYTFTVGEMDGESISITFVKN